MSATALANVRVVELCSMVAGPYCTKLLADLGAEVLKVEEPGVGDEARSRGPFLNDIPHPERSGLFFYINTNKLGVTLDLGSDGGREAFRRLVEETDILVEDRAPGALDSMGLGYESLRQQNPRLVMTSITPFGQTGPYRDYKAYPLNSFHSCGEGHVTPGQNPFPDRPPLKQGRYLGEYEIGIQSALATLGALYYQRATGLGQFVDISKQEALVGISTAELSFYPNLGFVPTRGTRGYTIGGIMPCKDGFVEICLYSEQDWEGLVKLMDGPDWAEDEKYRDIPSRSEHSVEVQQLLTDWLMQNTMEEIYQRGQKLRVPVGAYYSPRDLLASAQLMSRGFFVELDHSEIGKVSCPTAPYRFSKTPWRAGRSAPLLGEHNEEVFHRRRDDSRWDLASARRSGGVPQGSGQTGALSGVTVLEFGGMLAGAVTTRHLSLMGARVIKVESSRRMDITRVQHPGAHAALIEAAPTDTFMTNETNLNKLDVTLNLARPEGIELAKRLVETSDVLVENFRPGVMDRLGLGYEALSKLKPDLIMLSISMAGGTGPEAHYTGYAPIFSALGGVGHITGYADGPATEIRFPVDVMVGTTAAFAIIAALIHRRETGEGQHIDLSAREAASCMIGDSILDYTMNGRNQSREGNLDEVMAPHNCYPCTGEDKWISIAVKTDEEWSALCRAMSDPPWTRDKRFSDGAGRLRNREALDAFISEWTAQHAHYELMHMLQKAGVAAVPSFDAQELCSDPHLTERNLLVVVDHATLGAQSVFSPPAKLSLTPAQVATPGPTLGQHNHYVFGELLDLSPRRITELIENEVIC